MIISKNKGGLSNRIKSLVSCLRYANENNIDARVYWPILDSYKTEKHILNCSFNKLFKNNIEIKELDEKNIIYDCPCLKIFDEDNVPENFCKYKPKWKNKFICKDKYKRDVLFSYNNMPKNVKINYISYFQLLKPIDEIQEKINTFSKKFNENTISVHIRSWCRPNEKSRASVLFIEGIKKFELELNNYPNSNFFISTDSEKVKHYFKNTSLFKNRIFFYPRTTSLKNSRSTPLGIKEDLIELYLLSRNKQIIGSYNSTFTEVAWWLGKCTPHIIIL